MEDSVNQYDEISKAKKRNHKAIENTDKNKQNVKKAANELANKINNQ